MSWATREAAIRALLAEPPSPSARLAARLGAYDAVTNLRVAVAELDRVRAEAARLLDQRETEIRTLLDSEQLLRAAIIRHRAQTTGQDMCWENDEELWLVLGDSPRDDTDHTPPPWDQFLPKCVEYCASRHRRGGSSG